MTIDRFKEKLIFQANHRGIRENNLLLGAYAKDCLSFFSAAQLHHFEQFLQESDLDIFGWIVHNLESPEIYQELIENIITYHDQQSSFKRRGRRV